MGKGNISFRNLYAKLGLEVPAASGWTELERGILVSAALKKIFSEGSEKLHSFNKDEARQAMLALDFYYGLSFRRLTAKELAARLGLKSAAVAYHAIAQATEALECILKQGEEAEIWRTVLDHVLDAPGEIEATISDCERQIGNGGNVDMRYFTGIKIAQKIQKRE